MKRLLPLIAVLVLAVPAGARSDGASWFALVTAETENQVIAVSIPSGHVVRRFHLPADPENVDARPGVRYGVVVSTRGRAVTLIDTRRVRVSRILHHFTAPHIAAITPDGRYAYVTDDGSGKLHVIGLRHRRLVRRVSIGIGAHHIAISPDGRRTWVALGERAHEIVVLNTARPVRPRLLTRFSPRGTAHDLAFTPSGARVWVTSDTSSRVGVYDGRTHRFLKTFSGGAPPQHVAFLPFFPHGRAFVTSGYAGTMQVRNPRTGRFLRTVRTGYGSFNLGVGDGFVATSSLLGGTLTAFGDGRRLGQWHLAPAARDAAMASR